MQGLRGEPFSVTYRELWTPETIRGNQMPALRGNAHALALTNAIKASTADGIEFNILNTSNVNFGAIHNAQAKFWLSLRFRLNRPHVATSPNKYIWGKYIDADNYIYAWLNTADGALHFKMRTGAVDRFDIASAEVSWGASVWYHATFSISSAAGVRMIVIGGTPVTNADLNPLPNGGDLVVGDYDDPGAGTGFPGVISDVFCGTDDLTSGEETNLYGGFPPADVVHIWFFDEGRGATSTDRIGANNGTLDTNAIWRFGKVRQPVLSLNSVNSIAASATGKINAPYTLVWVGKMKSTYQTITTDPVFFLGNVDGTNYGNFSHHSATNDIRWIAIGGGVSRTVTISIHPVIDDYWIFIGLSGDVGYPVVGWLNGSSLGLTAGDMYSPSNANATLDLGGFVGALWLDISKPLFVAMVEGNFNNRQAKEYSRWLRDKFNLPITI